MKTIKPQIKEAPQLPSTRNMKTTSRHIIIKLLTTKDKIYIAHGGTHIMTTADFLLETMKKTKTKEKPE